MTAPVSVDAERFLIGWLQSLTADRVVAETPSAEDWPESGRLYRVLRIGGPTVGHNLDVATVVIDAFALSRREVIQMATDARTWVLSQLRNRATTEGARVVDVGILSGPAWAHNESDVLRRQMLTCQIAFH